MLRRAANSSIFMPPPSPSFFMIVIMSFLILLLCALCSGVTEIYSMYEYGVLRAKEHQRWDTLAIAVSRTCAGGSWQLHLMHAMDQTNENLAQVRSREYPKNSALFSAPKERRENKAKDRVSRGCLKACVAVWRIRGATAEMGNVNDSVTPLHPSAYQLNHFHVGSFHFFIPWLQSSQGRRWIRDHRSVIQCLGLGLHGLQYKILRTPHIQGHTWVKRQSLPLSEARTLF